MTAVTVIGVGNPYRRDDGVGPAVVAALRLQAIDGVEYAETDGEPVGLIELWQDSDTAIVVDAVRTPQPRPGRIHRLSAEHPAATATSSASSHGVDLGDAVALARALDRLPRRLLLYGVEVADTEFGFGLSEAVAVAVDIVVDEIADLLRTGTAVAR